MAGRRPTHHNRIRRRPPVLRLWQELQRRWHAAWRLLPRPLQSWT